MYTLLRVAHHKAYCYTVAAARRTAFQELSRYQGRPTMLPLLAQLALKGAVDIALDNQHFDL